MTMSSPGTTLPYSQLVALADQLLEECDEDVDRLVQRFEALAPEVRNDLFSSDLFNAYQVFYYFFRQHPDELVKERMELEPASVLLHGLKIEEIELLELYFVLREGKPIIMISDGDRAVATFSGRTAFADGMEYLSNPEYNV
jgi:hypothetical protein